MASISDRVGDVGGYLREQREHARLSLRQLAQLAGVSNPYLSQVERGLRKPSAEVLQQIARGLQISAEALYVRAGILESEQKRPDVEAAVQADPDLSDRQKRVLLDIYSAFRAENVRTAEGASEEPAPVRRRSTQRVEGDQSTGDKPAKRPRQARKVAVPPAGGDGDATVPGFGSAADGISANGSGPDGSGADPSDVDGAAAGGAGSDGVMPTAKRRVPVRRTRIGGGDARIGRRSRRGGAVGGSEAPPAAPVRAAGTAKVPGAAKAAGAAKVPGAARAAGAAKVPGAARAAGAAKVPGAAKAAGAAKNVKAARTSKATETARTAKTAEGAGPDGSAGPVPQGPSVAGEADGGTTTTTNDE